MKKPIFLALLLVSFLSKTFAQIEGDVVDSTDKGIAKAIIKAVDTTGKPIDSVLTDDRGFYEFKNLKPGIYRIIVNASGFTTSVFEKIKANKIDRPHADRRDDLSNATRLDIVLSREKSN